ncbi:MAG: hypothetical protein NUV53_00735, partial [Patescibacteria group bacterium]|nr:hypothetical protein [Patescibacteria group bacterium]
MKTVINKTFDAFERLTEETFGVGTRPTNFIVGVKDILEGLWNSSNYHVQRALWAIIGMGIATPILLFFVALIGSQEATALVALILLLGWFVAVPLMAFAMWQDPLLLPLIATTQSGRAALAKLTAYIGIFIACEFGFGLFVSVVPVANDMFIVVLILLAGITAVGCWLAGWKGAAQALGFFIAILIVVLCLGGLTSAKTHLSKVVATMEGTPTSPSQPPSPPQEYIVYSGDGYCSQLPAGLQVAPIIVDTKN